ncbi:MAG: penicillin acylase family protein [Bryobacterales bacterium]|nr:penicillin acylase family protein [Bryobacterales bacterium]
MLIRSIVKVSPRSLWPLACIALLTASCSNAPSDLNSVAQQSLATIDGQINVKGLAQPVEVIRDQWGVPHIYAQSVEDLFFAQGYVIAQDRLWQMEWWRRDREGRLAEILGPAAVERDRLARLTKFQGPFDETEWTRYHPEAKRLMDAYVRGVNTYITDTAGNLPLEFKLTGTRPEPWTPETVVLRANQRVVGDASSELRLARSVAQLGVAEANKRAAPDPWDDLKVPEGLDVRIIGEAVLESLRGGGPGLPKPEIVEPYRNLVQRTASAGLPIDLIREIGSNNWVMSGKLTATGMPVIANDPHREVSNPSGRYLMHLHAPGWNVIGASEAPFIGIHIGHNQHLGWGLTVVGTDQADVYVEEVNPANANEVLYNGKWEPLRVVREEIKVKGEAPRQVELKFSRHGPVFHEDVENKRAYVLRSVSADPGSAWYLNSLRLAQAADCKVFLEEGMYWGTPSENLICGDVQGNIAWLAAGLAPVRSGWSGRLPVPGTGKYEWQGFRKDLPREFNPERGFVATANHNIHPKGFTPPLMYKSAQSGERIARILQVIQPGKKFSMEDQQNLQVDMYSTRAEADMPLFEGWKANDEEVESARDALLKWDRKLRKESMEAAVYIAWREAADETVRSAGTPLAARRKLAQAGLEKAIQRLKNDFGADRSQWRYGRMHTRAFPHPFVSEFDLPAVERGGGAGTVAADGASFREILDAGDWDRSMVTQVPGQSGQPGSRFYGNLLPLWAENEYFPLVFSREAVEKNAAHRLTLQPR